MIVAALLVLHFFNGYSLSLPDGVCVTRASGPDFWVYRFATAEDPTPFLQMYAGYAANFPYTVPPAGAKVTEPDLSGRKPPCGGQLLIRETAKGELTHVGAAVTMDGKRCGEILVRRTAADGSFSSDALHFSYSGITAEQESLARRIIDSVRRSEFLPDDPPLDQRATCARMASPDQ